MTDGVDVAKWIWARGGKDALGDEERNAVLRETSPGEWNYATKILGAWESRGSLGHYIGDLVTSNHSAEVRERFLTLGPAYTSIYREP